MIYLEKKVAISNEMVYLKEEEESKGKIEVEKARLDQVLVDKTRETDQKGEDLVTRRIQLVREQGYDRVMSTKEEARIEVPGKEQAPLQDFTISLEDELRDFRVSNVYVQREGDIFRGILADVDKERIRAYLIDQGRDRLEAVFNKAAEEEGIYLGSPPLEKEALGSLIVLDREESSSINANFQAKIGSLSYELEKVSYGQLKIEGGAD